MIWSVSRFSIANRFFIGFVPLLITLGTLIFSNYNNFNNFLEQFENFSEKKSEQVLFLKIEKDIFELQRNVLVFSYTGYTGIQKKISLLQDRLTSQFSLLLPIAEQNSQIKNRLDRIIVHFQYYSEGFGEVVKLRKQLTDTKKKQLSPLLEDGVYLLESTLSHLKDTRNFESAFKLANLKSTLLQINNNTHLFEYAPDIYLIKSNIQLMEKIHDETEKLKIELSSPQAITSLDDFLSKLKLYEEITQKVINLNRVYLHLINVALAGRVAEITHLCLELADLVDEHSNTITGKITINLINSRNYFLIFFSVIGIMGMLIMASIAKSIIHPVQKMATALSSLANGKLDTQIPGQYRHDEIGEMAKAANEFKCMAIDLDAQTTELEEFAYRTSHDLRSPLVSSIALLKVAHKSITQGNLETGIKSLEFVSQSLEKLETLVEDILELTRTKNIKEDYQQFDINKLVEECIQKLDHFENYKKINFLLDLDPESRIMTMESRTRLIIENLVSNAIKYYNPLQEKPFISIFTKNMGKQFIFTIEDNGLGIPSEHQEKMFMMFKRFHPKTSFGSGLGLYMIKKSLQILNGTIRFEDTGSGSKFIVTFPIDFNN